MWTISRMGNGKVWAGRAEAPGLEAVIWVAVYYNAAPTGAPWELMATLTREGDCPKNHGVRFLLRGHRILTLCSHNRSERE